MDFLRVAVRGIDALVDFVGRAASFIVFVLMGLLFLEVVQRYVFDAPTSYAHELSAMLFAIMFLFGGSYAVRWGSHVSVTILVDKLSLRARRTIQLLASPAFYLFVGTLFVKSIPFAIDSVQVMERSASSIAMPVWPVKICLATAAGLMLLAGVSTTIKAIFELMTGEPLVEEVAARQLMEH